MKNDVYRILFVSIFLAGPFQWAAAAPVPAARQPKEMISFRAHRFDAEGLMFDRTSKLLVSCGSDEIKVWEVPNGKLLHEIQAHSPAPFRVQAVAISPDGKKFASCAAKEIKLWDMASGKIIDTLAGISDPQLRFSPDGKMLTCGYHRFDLTTKKDYPLVEKPTGAWPVTVFTPKGKLLVGMSFLYPEKVGFAVWDAERGKKIIYREGSRKIFHCDAFSPDGKTVVSTEGDHDTKRWAIRLWDIASGKNTATFELPEVPYAPTFSPDGKVLAVSIRPAADRNDYPGSVRLYEVSSGKVLANLRGYNRHVLSLSFSSDGRLLATGSMSGIIKIWSLPVRYKSD